MHTVYNLRHVIKFAVDTYIPNRMHLYAMSMALVGAPFNAWQVGKDYMYVLFVALDNVVTNEQAFLPWLEGLRWKNSKRYALGIGI